MLNKFFGVLAPAIFTKGIYRYYRGDYRASLRLLKRAAKWWPELHSDGLLLAYLLLIKYHQGEEINLQDLSAAIEKLSNSSFKDLSSYPQAEAELKSILHNSSKETIH